MTVTITWQMVLAGITLLGGWTGFLLGAIKWLLNRQITGLENRLAAAEKKAGEAVDGMAQQKEKLSVDLAKQKETLSEALAALRLEVSSKFVCGNHIRLEKNDEKLFARLDQVHGDVREMKGGVKALSGQLELVNRHLINGD
ncbi:MAG: hypothetical protein V1791_06780 [Pseudomonadota bacterium]